MQILLGEKIQSSKHQMQNILVLHKKLVEIWNNSLKKKNYFKAHLHNSDNNPWTLLKKYTSTQVIQVKIF